MDDLAEAIVLNQEALGLCPQGHPDRSTLLSNLAGRLSSRYKQLGAMEDLEEAIVLDRESLCLHPQGHPDWLQSLENLAHDLWSRFTRSKQLPDKEELFSLCTQLVHVPQFVSSSDLSVTRAWTRVTEACQHPSLLLAYGTYLRLLIQHLAILLHQELVHGLIRTWQHLFGLIIGLREISPGLHKQSKATRFLKSGLHSFHYCTFHT